MYTYRLNKFKTYGHVAPESFLENLKLLSFFFKSTCWEYLFYELLAFIRFRRYID